MLTPRSTEHEDLQLHHGAKYEIENEDLPRFRRLSWSVFGAGG